MIRFGVLIFLHVALLSGLKGQTKPNVIVILADDVGSGDVSYYRRMHSDHIVLETPNLDQLSKEGMVFTNAHAPAALCAPSRYAIMTGNSCFRSPYPWGVWGAYQASPIKKDQLTLGKLMKQAGYNTAFLGKWNLGGDWYRKSKPGTIYRAPRKEPELDIDISKFIGAGPKDQGFDYDFTFPSGIQDVPYACYENQKWYPLAKDSKFDFITQEKMNKLKFKLDKSEGLGDSNWDPHKMGPLLISKAVDYINKNASRSKPFFMYYCALAVHLPHTPCKQLDGIKIKGSTPTYHMDMIKELDVQIGMMIKTLKKKGIYDNTLIIFTSDNGGLTRKETLKTGHRPSDIYRGGKNRIHEGGHRVPFIVSWPKNIKNGLSDQPILGLDIMATLASLTNTPIANGQALDSKDIGPYLNNSKTTVHTELMLQGGTQKTVAILENNWKLIIQIDPKDKTYSMRKAIALFNLSDNVTEDESKNLIHSPDHKAIIEKLFTKYNHIRDQHDNPAHVIQ
ncbi:sulfatase family protein [Saccharicrinis fermentans]|uniref:Choline-sulfatase n=1 Tax=Saccharicrinis fermentans DSM 9555 = JCM 21142 TaxID=869213 RepID=W7Y2P7_9BACT|nr:arylsulfatase [Saccharicrinis fermentans]GAF02257.1 choline-sulfatase [Saccharicrinis fermentans DSM 9555 = JCM 21142]